MGHSQKMNRSDKKELKKASIEVKFSDYVDAHERVKTLVKKYPQNDEVKYVLAICRLHQKDNERYALDLLSEISNTKIDPNFYYYLGLAQQWNSQFENAINSLQTVLINPKRTVEDIDVLDALNRAYKSKELINVSRKVVIQNFGKLVNSEHQESVPVMTPDHSGLFYTARKPNNINSDKDHLGHYFQDIYFAKLKDGTPTESKNLTKINSKYHDASVSISADGNTFIFFKTNELNVNTGDLYTSTIGKEGAISEIKKLSDEINSSYVEPSACLSPDGNTLYFSSNRPGGYGGFDLYKSKKLPNGEWGKITNLGASINTKKNEDGPFMHADGKTLYFSSNGHLGLGGFDIFSSKLKNDIYWSIPENIGSPINTIDHDMYFTLSPDSREGYLSSNREGGFGSDDLYKVIMMDHKSYNKVIKGIVLSEMEKQPILSKITVISEQDKNLNGIYRTNANSGKFIMVVKPLETYQIIIESKGYEVKFISLTSDELMDMDLEIVLKPKAK